MSDNATVSNASTSSNPDIPVRSTETAGGKQIQHIRLDFGVGSAESVATPANPFPVLASATLAAASAVTTETVVTIGTSSTAILASNANRKGGWVKNIGDTYVFVSFSATATTAKPTRLAPGESLQLASGAVRYTGAVAGIVSSGSGSVEVVEL